MSQARAIEGWDKDAASLLRAQAMAARGKAQKDAPTREPYDPMRTRAWLLRHYQGGLSRRDLQSMDYREYFGYIRELEIMLEHESHGSREQHSASMAASQVAHDFPEPLPYEGETIQLISRGRYDGRDNLVI